MDRTTHDRIVGAYWDLLDRVQADQEYAALRRMCAVLEQQYETVAATMPNEQREVLERYITCRESLNRRALEFACTKLLKGE